MQREDILGEALKLLETQGIADTTLEMVAERVNRPLTHYSVSGQIKKPFYMTRYVI